MATTTTASKALTTPHPYDFVHRQGDNWTPTPITVIDGGAIVGGVLVGGTPRNFTSYTGRMQIRKPGGALVKELTTGAGISLSSAGVITLAMTAAETLALTPGVYVYDMKTISPGGTVKTWIAGTFTITALITTNS